MPADEPPLTVRDPRISLDGTETARELPLDAPTRSPRSWKAPSRAR